MTAGCLSYVYAEVQTFEIGYTIRKQEATKAQSLDRARALKYNIACLKAPQNLERRLLAQRILLESPKSWQTLVLSDGDGRLRRPVVRPAITSASFFGRFFVGTAQAEAKEPTNR